MSLLSYPRHVNYTQGQTISDLEAFYISWDVLMAWGERDLYGRLFYGRPI